MRSKFAATLLAALMASTALAGSVEEAITKQLTDQGFTRIEITRTWLGRVRIEAESGRHEREIVVNPRTGEILRDYWESSEDNEEEDGPNIMDPADRIELDLENDPDALDEDDDEHDPEDDEGAGDDAGEDGEGDEGDAEGDDDE